MLVSPFATIKRLPAILFWLIVWSSVNATAQKKPDFEEVLKVAKVSAPLTTEERTLAAGLGEQALKSKKLYTEKKLYLVEARMYRDTAAERKGVFERRAALTYYRYEGRLTIEVLLNLGRKEVLTVKELPNIFPPVSPDELTLAKELALKDPRLQSLLQPYRDRLNAEVFVSRTESTKDPLFRHRVVYLMFRVGPKDLLPQSRVYVDLTTEKVVVEPVDPRKSM
jgi:hypothetical protein